MHESGNRIKLKNGKIWGVAGAAGWTAIKTVKYDTPHILIPIDEIEGMSSQDIGNSVLAMLEEARFCQAQDYAVTLLSDPGYEYLSGNDEELQNIINKALDVFYEFQGKDRNIDKCISIVEKHQEEKKNKKKLKSHKIKHRKIASSNYERLFIKLGRKFGFKCLCCGSSDHLEIDHIEPVSIGGTTEFTNLQLLCKPCNLKKGVQTIDYRPNE